MIRLIGAGLFLIGSAVHAAAPPSGIDFFEQRIRPVLVQHCSKCHSAESKKTRGGLTVDTRASLLAGGEGGPAIIAGDPEKSLLMKALRHEGPKMPSESKKLPDAVVADFEAWIRMGAPDPRTGKRVVQKGIDYEEGRKHWAYQPVKVVASPTIKDKTWPKGDLDKYVLARIEARELHPSGDAPAATLFRRLNFDLIGLPPTPEEAAAFETAFAQDADAAVKAAVDRLLASPRFGEHWARHWLDGVRFNPQIPSMEYYRDWVIRAFNDDIPYDRFLVFQLAGDLLPPATDAKKPDDQLIATQLLALNVKEMDPIEGMVEVIGQQILGVSINCAKCHDHKFDAYTQVDYYALAGILTSSTIAGKKQVARDGVALVHNKGVRIVALEEGKPSDTNLLIRGEKSQRGPIVPRRFPLVIAGQGQVPIGSVTKQSGRLELAKWLTDTKNPLTARVMANRIWQHMIGRPIVATPNDFGTQGEPPTNPELLDYLADRFVQSGWSVKSLIREIAQSHTYRQSSRSEAKSAQTDPENALLARMPVKRLQCEQLADALFFVAGALDLSVPGPVVSRKPGVGKRRGNELIPVHRAIYAIDPHFARMFDTADPELLVDKRESSVTAPQMLFFLNSPTIQAASAAVARRAGELKRTSRSIDAITAAHRLLFGRGPQDEERREAAAHIKKHGLTSYCHLLLCSSEFLYLE